MFYEKGFFLLHIQQSELSGDIHVWCSLAYTSSYSFVYCIRWSDDHGELKYPVAKKRKLPSLVKVYVDSCKGNSDILCCCYMVTLPLVM